MPALVDKCRSWIRGFPLTTGFIFLLAGASLGIFTIYGLVQWTHQPVVLEHRLDALLDSEHRISCKHVRFHWSLSQPLKADDEFTDFQQDMLKKRRREQLFRKMICEMMPNVNRVKLSIGVPREQDSGPVTASVVIGNVTRTDTRIAARTATLVHWFYPKLSNGTLRIINEKGTVLIESDDSVSSRDKSTQYLRNGD